MHNKKLAAVSLFVLLSILACQSIVPGSGTDSTPADVYLDLRNIWFETTPEDLQISYEPGSNLPYVVIMDMDIDGDTATIASSIVGDGSLYTSTGGGYIGGVGHENVRTASKQFVEVAGNFVDRMTLVTEFPLPSSGYIRFYVITPSGVYASEEFREDDLRSGNHEFSLLFLAGDNVITAIRIASGG
jgi:hypothetical protein